MSPETVEIIRGNLIKQLIYFDEEYVYLLERTSPPPAERSEIHSSTDRYRRRIAQILGDMQLEELRSTVLIGCTVTIRYDDDDQRESYTIVLPDYSNADEGFISFISPLGRKLLLSRIGDRVHVSSPARPYSVVVEGIHYRIGAK
jgi:transcription elongation factor GreA